MMASVIRMILMRVKLTVESSGFARPPLVQGKHSIGASSGVSTLGLYVSEPSEPVYFL